MMKPRVATFAVSDWLVGMTSVVTSSGCGVVLLPGDVGYKPPADVSSGLVGGSFTGGAGFVPSVTSTIDENVYFRNHADHTHSSFAP